MLKTIFLWLLGTLLVLQIIRIDVPAPPENIDPKNEIKAAEEIMSMIKVSCYDCHSYETEMPWYSDIAPISWSVKSHIKDGRKWLNFQEWENYDEEKKEKIYKGIVKTISYSMPLPSYLLMHEEAKLTQSQRKLIRKWAQSNVKEENY